MSIKVTHNAGFFSCCSIRLTNILKYINLNKQLPIEVDSSEQFKLYKLNNEDITYEYFEHYNKMQNININKETFEPIYVNDQFIDYSTIEYKNINPLVQKYFTPNTNINNIIQNIETKYNLDYKNICVLFYRGNDKNRETLICDYEEYVEYANLILTKNKEIKFLIQSDETEFIIFMTKLFPNNSFYFKDEIRSINKCDDTVDVIMKHLNNEFSKYYLGITIIMSKCNYIICGSGNCSQWIMYYRKNNNNTIQNLEGKWIINII